MRIYHPVRVDDDTLLLNELEHEALYARINLLPGELEDLLFDEATEQTIANTANQLNLSHDQTANLSRLVRKVIMGEIKLEQITTHAVNNLHTNPDLAQKINQIIREQILKDNIDLLEAPASTSLSSANPNNTINLRDPNQ